MKTLPPFKHLYVAALKLW